MKCKICNKEVNDIRNGVCFDCCEAESIIQTGLDMYDKGLGSDDKPSFNDNRGFPANTSMQKLQLLIHKGWKFQNDTKNN